MRARTIDLTCARGRNGRVLWMWIKKVVRAGPIVYVASAGGRQRRAQWLAAVFAGARGRQTLGPWDSLPGPTLGTYRPLALLWLSLGLVRPFAWLLFPYTGETRAAPATIRSRRSRHVGLTHRLLASHSANTRTLAILGNRRTIIPPRRPLNKTASLHPREPLIPPIALFCPPPPPRPNHSAIDQYHSPRRSPILTRVPALPITDSRLVCASFTSHVHAHATLHTIFPQPSGPETCKPASCLSSLEQHRRSLVASANLRSPKNSVDARSTGITHMAATGHTTSFVFLRLPTHRGGHPFANAPPRRRKPSGLCGGFAGDCAVNQRSPRRL